MRLLENLIAYYKLDESSGNAEDSVGAFDLTNNGTVTYGAAKINNGAIYGAQTKYLSIASNLGITNGACSFAGWIKLQSEITTGLYLIFDKADGGTDVGYRCFYDYNGGTRRLLFRRTKGGVADQDFTFNITLGTSDWYHIGYTYDGTTLRGYVNGVLVGSVAASGNGSTGFSDYFNMGNDGTRGTSDYTGDEWGVWTRGLSGAEILQLYAEGDGRAHPFLADGDNTRSIDLESGSTQYLTAPDSTTNSPTGDFTIEAWVKPESLGHPFCNKAGAGSTWSWDFQMDGSGHIDVLISRLGATGSNRISGNIASGFSAGVWAHLAIVYTASLGKVEVFKNGVSMGTLTDATVNAVYDTTGDFKIGINRDLSSGWDGLIDDFRLWGVARTAVQILANMSLELLGTEEGLKAYYKFENNLLDSTGNGNNLTNVNTAVFSTDVPFDDFQPLLADIRSYYKLDESSGNATDVVSSRTLTNNNTIVYSGGKINNGADLESSSSQYFNGANAILPWGQNQLSISLWFKFETLNATMAMLMTARTNQGLNLYYDGSVLTFSKPNVAQIDYTWTGEDTNWHHLVATAGPLGMRLYLDGVLVATGSNNANFVAPSTDLTHFGAYLLTNSLQSGWYLDGMLDEIGIWERDLDLNEVTALYKLGAGNQYPFPTAVNITVSASVLASAFSLPDESILLESILSPSPLVAAFNLPASAVVISTIETPGALIATFSIPIFDVLTPDVEVLASVLSAAFSLPDESILAEAIVQGGILTATFIIPAISFQLDSILTPDPVELALSTPSPFIKSTNYGRKYSVQGDDYSVKYI